MPSTADTAPEPAPRQRRASGDRPGPAVGGLERLTGRRWGYAVQPVDRLLGPFEPALHDGALGDGALDDGSLHDGSGDLRRALEQVPAQQLPTAARLRTAVFPRERGGYDPASVDAALTRLEDAVAELEDRRWVREHGEQARQRRAEELGELVLGRLDRPAGRRFRRPSGAATRGYAVEEVDRLCDHVLDLLGQRRAPQARLIREAVFAPERGPRSYEEQQVDAFLERLVELLRTLD